MRHRPDPGFDGVETAPELLAAARELAVIEAQAERIETPCGDGAMVWRAWGEGEALILLHGGFGSWKHWARNVLPLSAHFRVIAGDLPGLGDSDLPPIPYDGDTLSQILFTGIDRILDPGGRAHIACFSFSGIAGGKAAVMLGERCRSFTCVGAAGFGPRDTSRTRALAPIRIDRPESEQIAQARNNLAVLMLADPAAIDDLAIRIMLDNFRRARIRSRHISLTDGLIQALPRIRGRLGAIWGAEDVTLDGKVDARNRLIRAADPAADCRVFAGAGHWVQYEAAERFNREFAALLAALP